MVVFEEMDNISFFAFEDGGFFDGYKTIEINVADDKIICNYNHSIRKGKRKTFEISKKIWREFLAEIIGLNILDWNRKYNNPEILDGEQWSIKIKFFNGNDIEINGNNDYPIGWEKYNEVIYKYFPIFSGRNSRIEYGKVYVVHNEWIQDPETGEMPYKIGITRNNVEDRYYGLGLKMPGEFVCDFAYEFGETFSKVEQSLHSILNKLNVNGEWFNINDETLEGIKSICELAGGKLITEIVETEIEKVTGEEIHPDLEKIVSLWNEKSDMKAVGRSKHWKCVHIPSVNTGLHYKFRIRNSKELNIELGCWTKVYPNMDKLFKEFDELKIKNHIFNYFPPSNSRELIGWKGKIRTVISLTEIDSIIEIMKLLIEQTKEKIIIECNAK